MRRGRGALVPLLPVLAVQACDSAAPSAGTLHSDSAGVAIAMAVEPAWGAPGRRGGVPP
jgi:hypothetical protein